jgi:transcriptional regulator GlxA family with amidase domain
MIERLAGMTKKPDFLPRRVLFAAYPNMGLFGLSGPQTVFWAATQALARRGLPGYELHTVSLGGKSVTTAEGLKLATRRRDEIATSRVDTLLVPGCPDISQLLERSDALVELLRDISRRSRRTAAVCTGAFLLARTGLLDNKRAATHWRLADLLQERFPAIKVERDAIFVREENIWTSAGVTAAIDLSLALIDEDCGREIAAEVAREVVVCLNRLGGQAQFSASLHPDEIKDGAFAALHQWISRNIQKPALSVDLLAEKAGMSPRNFARVYKQKTGRTPAAAIEVFRIDAARRLLEGSNNNIAQIADQCGFGNDERMRVSFHRILKVSPKDYRKRFSF